MSHTHKDQRAREVRSNRVTVTRERWRESYARAKLRADYLDESREQVELALAPRRREERS